mgnify:CR=1 FL=1
MKDRPSRRTSSDATVHRIMEAAADEFAESGFGGARMDAVARRAEVNKAVIYYHIGDKKQLYERVLHAVFGEAADRIEAETALAGGPEAKLRSFIRNISATVDRHRHMAPVMLREVAAGGADLPDSVLEQMARIVRVLGAILAEGEAEKVFGEMPPFVLHLLVTGTTLLFKASGPIRKRMETMPDGPGPMERPPERLMDRIDIADVLEPFILRAIARPDGAAAREGDAQ